MSQTVFFLSELNVLVLFLSLYDLHHARSVHTDLWWYGSNDLKQTVHSTDVKKPAA